MHSQLISLSQPCWAHIIFWRAGRMRCDALESRWGIGFYVSSKEIWIARISHAPNWKSVWTIPTDLLLAAAAAATAATAATVPSGERCILQNEVNSERKLGIHVWCYWSLFFLISFSFWYHNYQLHWQLSLSSLYFSSTDAAAAGLAAKYRSLR